ncbi:hypothetical protein AB0N09_08460 [Streptomyces erythrochromogenes]|uniref:hypothetical protein n=1 Tax=Streptomyces erythrochromogenes TaxID=285574 RepID=UPI0034194588
MLTHDQDGFRRSDRPHRIVSGALHHFRVHPDQWEDRLTRPRGHRPALAGRFPPRPLRPPGPQRTLCAPGPLRRDGENEPVVLETDRPGTELPLPDRPDPGRTTVVTLG